MLAMWILHCNPQGELVVQSESFSKEHILRTKQHRSYGSNFKLEP